MTRSEDDSNSAFLARLQTQDALGALLHAHFQAEVRLQQVLEWCTPHDRELPELSYEQKARLAVTLGLDGGVLPVLQMLDRLRHNAIRHFDAGLTEPVINQLFGLLEKRHREEVLQRHAGYAQAAPLARFNVIAAVIDAVLAAACRQVLRVEPAERAEHAQAEAEEVITFEWSAPVPRHPRDFASKDALFSWLTVRD
jgi:hypothetical protein